MLDRASRYIPQEWRVVVEIRMGSRCSIGSNRVRPRTAPERGATTIAVRTIAALGSAVAVVVQVDHVLLLPVVRFRVFLASLSEEIENIDDKTESGDSCHGSTGDHTDVLAIKSSLGQRYPPRVTE